MKFLTIISVICLISSSVYAQPARVPAGVTPSPPVAPPSPPGYVSPCVSGMYNPCGVGSCVDLLGSYRCICPPGYVLSSKASGSRYCSPIFGYSQSNLVTYTTVSGDTCPLIAITFRVPESTVARFIGASDCYNLPAGIVLFLDSPLESRRVLCRIRHTVVASDTCVSLGARYRVNVAALNPGLSCNFLVPYSSICLQSSRNKERYYFCVNYKYALVSSSITCALSGGPLRTVMFNHGLLCGNLDKAPKRYCFSAAKYSVLTCKNSYIVGAGDTCASILSDEYDGSLTKFRTLNRRMRCDDFFLFVGQKLCKA